MIFVTVRLLIFYMTVTYELTSMEGKIIHETRCCNDKAGSGGNAERTEQSFFSRASSGNRYAENRRYR